MVLDDLTEDNNLDTLTFQAAVDMTLRKFAHGSF